MAAKNKYYVVWEGNQPGIYESWTECQLQIKGYPNAKYKAFKTLEEAEQAYRSGFTFKPKSESIPSKKPTSIPSTSRKDIVWDSISVDAACSGNPGLMEYQGVDTKTGMQIFHKKFSLGTNNIGEFLAIVHALAMFKQQGKVTPIYTDSKIAMGWVARKQAKTTLKHTPKTALLHDLIKRAETWLKNNTYPNKIMKWKTEEWGEIPADFGRK
jgi:ribonuclease HI